MNEIIIAIVSGLIIIIGGIGSILPVLPGPPLSYAGLFLYAWYTGFDKITPTALIVFGILTALTFVTDFLAPALGAKGYKASWYGVIGSLVGAFAGVFALGPLGIILGPFVGGFIGEMMHANDVNRAVKIAWGSFVGFMVGSIFKVGVIFGMLAYLVYVVIK